jgi:hypothetical protein
MNAHYRLTVANLFEILDEWNIQLNARIFVAACGGTALTLYGYKESTLDVDFLIPDLQHHDILIKALSALGYKRATGNALKHPSNPWIFDLFRGQTIIQTELLDPIQDEGKHRVIKVYDRIVLACINPDDLIISKMFRGTQVDVQDSILMIKTEKVDLKQLAQRYKETAGYYYNPAECKKNFGYLIGALDEQSIDTTLLREMDEQWTP